MEEKFMKEALKQAKKAASIGETPIGAVIVRDGEIIARGYNKRETKKNALLHAEIIAINKACKNSAVGDYRDVKCMLRLSLVRCVQGRLSIRVLKRCISVRMTKSPVVPVRLSIYLKAVCSITMSM